MWWPLRGVRRVTGARSLRSLASYRVEKQRLIAVSPMVPPRADEHPPQHPAEGDRSRDDGAGDRRKEGPEAVGYPLVVRHLAAEPDLGRGEGLGGGLGRGVVLAVEASC